MKHFSVILIITLITVIPGIIVLKMVISNSIKSRKKLKESFDRIAARIGGRTNTSLFSLAGVEGNYKGIPIKITYDGGGENSPPHFTTTFSKIPTFRLVMYEENPLTRFGKKFRFVKEVVLNIPDFDKKFFIWTNDRIRSSIFLSDSRNRETILKLHRKGWRLTFGKSAIEVQKTIKTKEMQILANGSKGFFRSLRTFLSQVNSPDFFQPEFITPDEVTFVLESLYELRC